MNLNLNYRRLKVFEYELVDYLGFDKPTEKTGAEWQDYFELRDRNDGVQHETEMLKAHGQQ